MTDWKPQPYRRTGRDHGVPDAVLDAAVATGEKVVAVHPSLPPILTLGHLAHLCGVDYKDLRAYASRDEPDPYKLFRIRKRPQSDGTLQFRLICVPQAKLAEVQRWIAKNVLTYGRPHAASTAFSPGAKLIDAVRPHCGSRWIVKVDVRRFFESISEISAYKAFRQLGYQPLVSFELARLCTRVAAPGRHRRTNRWYRRAPLHVATIRNYAFRRLGHLPQGAPTSPMLANLVMRGADDALAAVARSFDVTYTRYADDLTFSTASKNFDRDKAGDLIQHVYRILGRFGLEPNLAKTQVIPPRARKVVLGLLADQEAPRLSREFKSKMRMHLHYLEREDVGPVKHAQRRGFSAVAGLRNHLLGLAAYAGQIEPGYAAELRQRLMAVRWPVVF
jgi:RNA-directed DNA polymerase